MDTDLTRAVNKEKLAEINQRISRPHGTTLSQAVDFILDHLSRESISTGNIYYLGEIP